MSLPFPRLRIRLATGAAMLATTSMALAACGSGDSGDIAATPGEGSDPGVGHIHGLGVDPADGVVYVAAHYGLFKIAGQSSAVRIAGRYQDTMGFTIVGPKTFLASGHPAMTEMSPGTAPHLGLIRSADAGNTWTPVSQAGKADFHSLQPAGNALYAYDSQTGWVRRSDDDGRTWKAGARLQVLDLAAHQERPDRVYATTPQGLRVSVDGGVTYAAMAGAPALTHLDAVAGGGLVGIGPDGQVYTGHANGGTWSRLGRIPAGQATAFTAVDRRRLLAATESGTVYESRDGGRTFTVSYRAG
jgi:photosystem II stability/assembly factor-like uncharacterized protein